ncbi:TROVE domain-containing protein [Flavitalea sp. BT771]|uniref:TROVE domain-containing protein n=1 Tax=Flavitalea sp. BT771 TaxID=3063329 RepID=UPI0026E4129E|nr:TROVE domain-containing protein [Flavitalea sp. BT771]MDO6434175.1 TROVE domain-containing protein [Flavitalea sp. BT771]MDV6223075.1 TROVE domain-containing protein [Flavitalea sp. BT771]
MKFNFSLRARQTDERYAFVRTWTVDKQWELYEALLCMSLYESFYDQPAEQLAGLRKLIRDNDPVYVARLAVHFREKLHLRTLSFILAAELSGICKDKELVGRLTGRVIQHAGEIPGWLDHYAHVHGNKRGKGLRMTTALRKHLAIHFNRLDTYRFVRLTKAQQARLRYALSLVQPKAAGKAQQALFRRIQQDKLPARNAWLSEYEALRQQNYDSREIKQSALRDKWKEGISTFRMGYAALLDHLPNILKAGVSGKVLKLAAAYLGNEAAVTGSRQSPLRFVAAYRKLQEMPQGGAATLQEALEQALLHSAHYLACLDESESTVIAMDVSPSMRHPVKEGSLVQRYDIAPLLAMLLKSRGDKVTTGIIGNTWKVTSLPSRQLLGELERLHKREGEAGYALNAHLVIQDLLKKGAIVDKVMIFTDCQLWNQRSFNQPAEADLGRLWRQYRELAPKARLYLFDLAGYGKKPLECLEDGVYLAAGWNEQVFGVLKALENEGARMETIEDIIV